MIFRRLVHVASSSRNSWSVSCGLSLILIMVTACGCRTPWRATQGQPDFDRLIEIERQQSGRSATQREPLAARHRPGGSAAASPASRSASPYAEDRREERSADDIELAANDNLRGSTRRSISESDDAARVSRHITDDDFPLDSNNDDSATAARSSNPPSVKEQLANAPTDRHGDSAQSYVGDSKYQLAANGSQRQERDAVLPRAVEQPYTRSLSDAPQSRSPSPATRPIANTAPNTSAVGPVVTASYGASAQSNLPASQPVSSQLTWREHIQQALQQLEQESVATSPEEQVHRGMVDRLLHLSLGDINAASEPIDGLQTPGQDFIRHSLRSLHEVSNPAGNPVEIKRYAQAMLSQRKALNHLASVSNLEVQNATFCTEVDGFGVITKFPQYNFSADQELLLYCELDNFVSEQIEGNGYETQLQGSYEIVDSKGRRVADQLLPLDSHLCRNQRRDYFIAYRIYMPAKIDPGKYQLKLTIEDLKGRKFGQTSMEFQIEK